MRFCVMVLCICMLAVLSCSGGATKSTRTDDRLLAGDKAPGFELPYLMTDETYSFGKEVHANRTTVVTLWSMACPSCRDALLEVQKAHDAYSAEGIVFIGVNFDVENLQGVRAFIKGEAVAFPTLWDQGRRVTKKYKALDYTFSLFVVDKDGVITLAQYDHPPDLYDVLAKTLDPIVGRPVESGE